MKIITKKKLKQETYVLDYSLIKWLNEHLKLYLKETNGIIDLTFHKFTYKKQEYTQLEISHTIYEDFLEENIIDSKFLYERIKKQLSILEDKEVSK